MISLLLMLALSGSCERGGKGAQCVTCDRSERGVYVCKGVCYQSARKADGGYRAEHLQQEDKDEDVAKSKVDAEAKEKCP